MSGGSHEWNMMILIPQDENKLGWNKIIHKIYKASALKFKDMW
jgi:hypothetical protein